MNVKRAFGKASLIALDTIEKGFDSAGRALRRSRGNVAPAVIQAYRGFGTEESLYVFGRVLENRHVHEARPTDSAWRNFAATYRRFASREIPHATVRARFQDAVREVRADDEGYFHIQIEPTHELAADRVWHEVTLELDIAPEPYTATALVQVPPVETDFAVISDMDDTVLKTGVTKRWEMVRNTLLRNVHLRLPFEGVAGLYRALQRGPSGTGQNPIFYVSSSPWNLFDVLVQFLELQGIPLGPIMLRDLGIDRHKFITTSTAAHKGRQIEQILSTYPNLKFILIGDSGQEDPEIYREAVRQHPDRILAIYIRDVSNVRRDSAMQALAEEVAEAGVEMVLVPDSEAAARHAAEQGYIRWKQVPEVKAEKKKDEALPK